MFKKTFRDKLKIVGIPVIVLIVFFILWEWWALVSDIPKFLLPRPLDILQEIFSKFGFFLRHLGITLQAAVIGFLIAVASSFILASLFVYSKKIEYAFYPYIIALKIAPVLALAPFIILWLGIDLSSKIAIVVLVCFFPLLVNTIKGLQAINQETFEVFKSFSASQWQVFQKLRFPNSLPYIFPALKISFTLALTGAFVGEFIAGGNKGIGYVILYSTRTLETTTALAGTTVIVLTGLVFFFTIDFLEKKVVYWQKVE